MATGKRCALWGEFVLLYFLVPLYYAFHRHSSPLLFLALLSLFSLAVLYTSKSFRNEFFLNKAGLLQEYPRILRRFALVAVALLLFTMFFYPDCLFYCPTRHFPIWLSLMIFYPLFSVYPQEIVYRAFLFHRYAGVLPDNQKVVHMSAIAFAFGHIIYFHPLSVILTLFGGYLFAWTYARSHSLLAASFEHAIYGCLLYTIGLGRFFYTGFDKLLQ